MKTPTFALLALTLAAGAGAAGLWDSGLRFQDDAGKDTPLSSFEGRTVVVTMFYSTCTTRCPMTLRKLKEIEAEFAKRGEAADFLLVSYDSRSDSPAALARYRKRNSLGERWHLLTGRADTVQSLADRLGLGGFRDLGDHMVHRFRILRIAPDGSVAASIDWEHPAVAGLFPGE